ncbi:hypothetical protein ACOQNK_17665 [Acinetobacter baumannii]|uniref:hypothetical protein n=1 Tax=Acinetobacter baumannii TaxID=470 RepID=UPI003BA94B5D
MDFINLDTWSVDWSAWSAIEGLLIFFATLYAARVAWKISKEWNNQKGMKLCMKSILNSPKPYIFQMIFLKYVKFITSTFFKFKWQNT